MIQELDIFLLEPILSTSLSKKSPRRMREDGWLLTLPGRYVEGMLTCSLDNKNRITSHKTKNNMQWIQATTTSMPLRSRQGVSQWSQAACGLRFVFGASETKARPSETQQRRIHHVLSVHVEARGI